MIETLALPASITSVAAGLFWAGWHVRGVKAAIDGVKKQLADHNGAIRDLYQSKVNKDDCDRLMAK